MLRAFLRGLLFAAAVLLALAGIAASFAAAAVCHTAGGALLAFAVSFSLTLGLFYTALGLVWRL